MWRKILNGAWFGLGRFGFLALIAMFIGQLACSHSALKPPAPRLVLVYATCSLNKNYLAAYDPRIIYTPHIRAFAQRARIFSRHQTEEGQSGIAFASLWTGTQAMHHGIYAHPEILDSSNFLMAEAFAEQGYETYLWDRHPMASASLNYGQGVNQINVKERMLEASDPEFVAILEKLNDDPRNRAFIMTNHTVSHSPYSQDRLRTFYDQYPEECRGVSWSDIEKFGQLFAKDYYSLSTNFDDTVARLRCSPTEVKQLISVIELAYMSRVNYLDELFGDVVEVIAKAGLLDQSIIVFTSDHGELLYRKNVPFKWWHGFLLAPEDLSIPLMIRGPGIMPGKYEHVTRSIDVFPTVAGLSGFRISSRRVMGVNLSSQLQQGAKEPALVAYSHTSLLPKPYLLLLPDLGIEHISVAAREGDIVYKLRWLSGNREAQSEVFDWSIDPEENHNLFDPTNRHHRTMVDNLKSYKSELVRAYFKLQNKQSLLPDKERIERLRSLGYIK